MAEFNALIYRRQGQIERLKRILQAGDEAENDVTKLEHFKICFKTAELTYQACQKLSDDILICVASDDTKSEAVKKQDVSREKDSNTLFDGYYWKIQEKFSQLFGSSNADSNQGPATFKPFGGLPKVNLPTFNGDFAEWNGYHDLFCSMVHENTSLSGVQKFQYLISTLSGEPLSIVKGLPLSSANYPIVFKKLCGRYGSKRILAQTRWQAICNLPATISDTSKSIYELLSQITENIAALNTLGLPTKEWSYILYDLAFKKLPKHLRTKFEEQSDKAELPTFDALHEFLLNHCRSLESVELSCNFKPSSNLVQTSSNQKKHFQKQSFVVTKQSELSNQVQCSCCKGNHLISKCPTYLANNPQKRFDIIRELHLCINCLKPSHSVKRCSSPFSCLTCRSRHHSTLHFDTHRTPSPSVDIQSPTGTSNVIQVGGQNHSQASSSTSAQSSNVLSATANSSVLLPTALIHVEDSRKNFQVARVLLDSGSQVSFISQKYLKRLGLSCSNFFSTITGINLNSPLTSNGITKCVIKPALASGPIFQIQAVVLDTLALKIPSSSMEVLDWSYLSHLPLADPKFHRSNSIDMILGAEVFAQILEPGKIPGQNGGPSAMNTVFGWIIMGRTPTTLSSTLSFTSIVEPFDLRKFWEVEEVESKPIISAEDQQCELIFKHTFSRTPSGRYVVTLPFKVPEPIHFKDSKSIAYRRFLSLERRFKLDTDLRQEYHAVIQNYIDSDHIQVADSCDQANDSGFFLPHHAVWKPESTTTRLRVVFDASAVSSDNLSLNSCLCAGPKLQANIFSLLLNFRLHRFVLVADIKQMYRQILVAPSHWKYQKILWRFDPNSPIQIYVLKCVVFGITPSPFLALRTIKQLVADEGWRYPLAARALQEDWYVDDCVSGGDTLEDTKRLQTELIKLLRLGQFELRKWASNAPDLLKDLPAEECQSISFDDCIDSFLKILGLHWLPKSDCFSFSVSLSDSLITKRNILSDIARIWDPLGFLAPITFFAKHLIQYLWSLGLSWDEIPPAEVTNSWSRLKSELPLVKDIQIYRFLDTRSPQTIAELHGFSDSSEKGYAACVYLRTTNSEGSIQVSLLSAKSKVASLKKISLARLELCGAVLLSNLFRSLLDSFKDKLTVHRIAAWCDSKIALSWIKSPPHRWKTFIANRVSHIQGILSPECWFYVKSADNPADVASRGMLPKELVKCSIWWKGPNWLSQTSCTWSNPETISVLTPEMMEEMAKPVKLVCAGVQSPHFLDECFRKFSSYSKIQRILCYILRFVHFIRNQRSLFRKGPLSEVELRDATIVLARWVQKSSFSEEIRLIETNKFLPKPFRKLAPFLDKQHVLRVGGRLKNSELAFDEKHPILLPKRHAFTDMIIRYFHHKFLHPGPQTLQYLVGQQFWILSAKHAINACIGHCYRCFRAKPRTLVPIMGNLPASRVSQLKAFSHSGVDMGGPFITSVGRYRGAKTFKSYLCLFVCFATKAVHLELTSSLTADAFLAAFRRFIARRGRVTDMYSDCGTNFVGANRALLEMAQQTCESLTIKWHFNPPGSPHMGGIWEAAIKSVKGHLARVLGEQTLTFEEMNTLLAQIEAVLNSRPLTAISTNPNDLKALSPNHFLTLDSVSSPPDENLETVPLNRLTRWQLIQRFQQSIWRRWQAEYLQTLQQRQKWHKPALDLEVGSLVILKNENLPPGQWLLGRITDLHRGNDGILRVATLQTKQGLIKRPLTKLCLLPVEK